MRHRHPIHAILAVALTLAGLASEAFAAPRVDPEWGARLAGVDASKLFGVILTFDGERVTDAPGSLAGTNVRSGGQTLTDNAQIPLSLRGYVQLALDNGLLGAFQAEIQEVGPGQYQVIPGPRFEPSRGVTRADFVEPATRMLNQLFGE